MKIKVCGMKIPDNITQLTKLNINFIGFIFYPKSKRYTNIIPVEIPEHIKKVGVFVNENPKIIINTAKQNNLDFIQLHGDETTETCKILKKHNLKLIKAFRIDENFDFQTVNQYCEFCNYFLFDTKGKNYGGNGVKFNWHILNKYSGQTPFLLSGGINETDVLELKTFKHQNFAGIDINSGFEIEPGLKNIKSIKTFIKQINNEV